MSNLAHIALALLAFVIVLGCGTGTHVQPVRQTALPRAPQNSPSTAQPGGLLRIRLEPEAEAVPAKLKDSDYRRVTGDYAYADLEAVLKLAGRIPGAGHEVSHVRFFERVAAAVTVEHSEFSSTQYLLTTDIDRVWQVVGQRDYYFSPERFWH